MPLLSGLGYGWLRCRIVDLGRNSCQRSERACCSSPECGPVEGCYSRGDQSVTPSSTSMIGSPPHR
jgi:hypothetical protein